MFKLTEEQLAAHQRRVTQARTISQFDSRTSKERQKRGKSNPDAKLPHASEHDEQVLIFKWWETYAAAHKIDKFLLFCIPNASALSNTGRIYKWQEGLRAGVPDITLCYPTREYAGLWIELKSVVGKPSAEQTAYIARLRKAGYRAEVCYGSAAAIRLIEEYLR